MITSRAPTNYAITRPLFSNTKAAEDQIQNVIRGGLASDGVQRTQRAVEIEHDHLVWNFASHGLARGIKAGDGFFHQALMAHVGEETAFLLSTAVPRNCMENLLAQLVNALPGKGRRSKNPEIVDVERPRAIKIRFVGHRQGAT